MLITEEEFKSLDYAKLNEILERTKSKAIEETLCFLPDVIIGLIVKTKGIHQTYETFKEKYPELKGREAELMQVVEQLELEDGSRNLAEILQMVPGKIKDIQTEIPKDQPNNLGDLERTCNGFI